MASSKTIALKIALNGEREFRTAMQAVKKETGLLNTELKNLDSKYKDNANTLEALRARQEKLAEAQEAYTKRVKAAQEGLENAKKNEESQNKRLQELKEKLEEAEKALQSMKDAGLENTEAYKKQEEAVAKLTEEVNDNRAIYAKTESAVLDWRKELNNAQTALDETNKEIQENEKYLEEASKSADGCATSIDKYGNEVGEAAEETGKLNVSLGDMVKNKLVDLAGDALRELGQKAVEAVKYVVEVGSSFEAQMSKVGAISGATGSDLEALTDIAEEMGRTTKFTATQAGEALEYMAMAGWKTDEMLEGLEGIMNLAAASGEDLGTTADIVTDALTAFGESASESGRLADIMAAASTNANTNVSMMGETFKYAAPIAGALGYSMEDTAVAIGLMANAGIKASQAGTSLRSGLTRLAAPTTQADAAMQKYGITLTDSDGKMLSFRDLMIQLREKLGDLSETEQTAAANAIFGKNAMSGWLAVLNGSDEDFDKLTQAIENSDGAAQRMADTMQDNLSGKLTILGSAAEGLGIALYNYVSGPLSGAVEFFTDIINDITNLISPQKTELEKFIDDIDKANAEVERSIDNAAATVEKGNADIAEIEGYKDILTDILDNCAEFNRIDLGNGRFNIVNAAGEIVGEGFETIDKAIENTNNHLEGFAPTGIGTEMIKWKVDEITGDDEKCLGYISKKADEVESELVDFAPDGINYSKISEGTSAIITCFDETGKKVDSFKTQIDETGKITANFEGIEEPTNALITIFNNAGEAVGTLETTIEGTGDVTVDLSGAQDGVTSFVEYLDSTEENTDAFKERLSETGEEFPTEGAEGSVDDIITYFDENGDEIKDFRGSIVSVGEAFDTEGITVSLNKIKEVGQEVFVVTDQFAKFQISTMVDVLSDSVDGLAEAWNAETGELSASREELESWFETAQTVAMQNALQSAMDELYSARADALINVAKAQSTQNQALKEFNELAGTSFTTYEEWLDKGSGQLGETIEYSKELAGLESTLYNSQDALNESNANLEKSGEELKNTSEALSGLKDVYLEGTDAVGKSAEEAAADLQQATEETGELADATQDLSETTSQVSEELSKEYGKILESIRNTVDQSVSAWKEMEEADEISVSEMIDNMQKNLDRTKQWESNMKILGQAIGQGFPQALYDELVTAGPGKMDKAVEDLVRVCQDPTSAEFAELGRLWDEKALEEMSAQQNIAPFTTVGTDIGASVANGIDDSTEIIEDSASGMVNQANEAAQTEAENFSAVGEEATSQISGAIESTQQEVENATTGMMDSSRKAADQMIVDFYTTGHQIPKKVSGGIDDTKSWAEGSARNMATDAAIAADERQNDFYNSGVNMVNGVANGINAGSNGPINAARNLAIETWNAFNNAVQIQSPSKKMKESGEYLVEGLIEGIQGKKDLAVTEAITFGEEVVNGFNRSIEITSENQGQYLDRIGAALWGSGVDWSKYSGKYINSTDFSRNAMSSQQDITQWASATLWRNLDTDAGKADMKKWLKDEFSLSGSDANKAINAVAKALQQAVTSQNGNISMFDSGGSAFSQKVTESRKTLADEAEKARAQMQIYESRAESLLKLADEKARLSSDLGKLANSLQKTKTKATDDIQSSMLAMQSQAATAARYKLMDQLSASIDTYKSDSDKELESMLSSLEKSSSSGASASYTTASSATAKSMDAMETIMAQTNKSVSRIRSITASMNKTLQVIADAVEAGINITIPVSIGNEKLDAHTVRVVKQAINTETRALQAAKGR